MINYDEEILKFKPSMDVSAVEDEVIRGDLTDVRDILTELLKEQVKTS